MENKKKTLFDIAKENSNYKVCTGCGCKKLIADFKKTNKYCTGCPTVSEIREKFKTKAKETSILDDIQSIDDINLDDFFN